jgi:hypothetical protein
MSLNQIIKKVIREQTENVIMLTPEEFKENLAYFNSDVALLKRYYKNKYIIIKGNLDLSNNEEIKNLNVISKIEGNLNIQHSSVDVFDDNKARSVSDYGSERYLIKKREILRQKFEYLDELRKKDAWNIQNGEEISYQTEALYKYLDENGDISYYDDGVSEEEVVEDKYFIYPEKYGHYGGGRMFTWLGDDKHESEYIVYNEDKIEDGAREAIQSRIDELGYEAFSDWLWEDNLDYDYVRHYLREYVSESIYDDPENWGLEKQLSDNQEKIIAVYKQKIEKLSQKLRSEDLDSESTKELYSEMEDIYTIIKDIKESPEGGYDEDDIESVIDSYVDDNEDNFISFLRDQGFGNEEILNFVDIKAIKDYIIRNDSWGDIIGSYDGSEEEYNINGHIYIVMRYN